MFSFRWIVTGMGLASTLGAYALGFGGGHVHPPEPAADAPLGRFHSAPARIPLRYFETCGDLRSIGYGKYCVARQVGSRNPDVLYYFHGLNDDEHFWLKELGLPIYERWRVRHQDAPTVVSISVHRYRIGNFWLLADRNSSDESGLLEPVATGAIPEIEKILGGVKGRRLLMGASMGGFNAAQLYLRYPRLFSRVALVCPAMTTVSPFAAESEIEDYTHRTGAKGYNVMGMTLLVKRVLPTESDYLNQAPLQTATQYLTSAHPPLHVSCGEDDEYGFQEGAYSFASYVRAVGVGEVTFRLLPTGTKHGVPNGEQIADFFYGHR